jgi:hypothetical protein
MQTLDLNVIVVKPSKYLPNGFVERFWRGFMPNATIPFIASMVPARIGDTRIHVETVDEYVHGDLGYLKLFDAKRHGPTLLLLVGVQSHQFQRALDLAAYAHSRGCMVAIGGPHPMTCDTSMLHGNGPSFVRAEAEVAMDVILNDAISHGVLQPIYGLEQRWALSLDNDPVLKMPDHRELGRYMHKQLGVYPARGCPFTCEFCAIPLIAGRNIRSQPISTTIATLRAAKAAGVTTVFFTSDNLNKWQGVVELCEAIIEEGLNDLQYFVQCDVQIEREPELLELFAKAGVYQVFLGIESFNQTTLSKIHKTQNRPDKYRTIKLMCDEVGVTPNFSMINGFMDDDWDSILGQLDEVRAIDPGLAWFFTLCPAPGTPQYASFLKDGLITEPNLDMFDATGPTWRHPKLTADQLVELFKICYRRFYTFRRARLYRPRGNQTTRAGMWAITAFMRQCALAGSHPMSGGIFRRRVDHVDSYIDLRRSTYGFDLVPLPEILTLSDAEEERQRRAKITPPRMNRARVRSTTVEVDAVQ